MNPTPLDLPILTLLLKGLIFAAPFTVLLLLAGPCLSARSLSLAWRTLLLAMLALPLISWALPGLPVIGSPAAATPDEAVLMQAGDIGHSAVLDAVSPTAAKLVAVRPATPGSAISWIFLVWLTGALWLGSRFVLGHLKAMVLLRKSRTFDEVGRVDTLFGSVAVLRSPGTRLPLTCGIRRPAIILPQAAADWDGETRRAVLTHELTHIRRRDLWFLVISAFAVALHWPNPFVFLAARRMRLADERAADDAVLSEGLDGGLYARLLFDLARDAPAPTGCMAAQFMAERSMIGSRIKCLLDARQNRNAPRPLAVAGASLVAVAAAVLVGTVTLREASAEPVEKGDPAAGNAKMGGQKQIEDKLKNLVIPMVHFEGVTLEEAIDFLHARAIELDPEPDPTMKGVNFLIKLDRDEREAVARKKITLKLKDVPLGVVLKYTTSLAGLSYRVEEFAVEIGGNQLSAPAKPNGNMDNGAGQKFIEAKLRKIVIPELQFDGVTIQEALEYFRAISGKLDEEPDPRKKGLNFMLRLDQEELKAVAKTRITLKLKNVPLGVAMEYATKAAGLNYRVSEVAVEVEAEPPRPDLEMEKGD